MSKYAKDYYGVPSDIGRCVTVSGRPGIIAEDRGNYIGVNFDDSKPGVISNCHPVSEVVYLEMGTVRKMTRSQQNYRDYRESETGLSFAEYMGFCR